MANADAATAESESLLAEIETTLLAYLWQVGRSIAALDENTRAIENATARLSGSHA